MSYKTDIQATRSTAAAGATAIVAPPVRLRGIIIASDGVGAGVLELTTTDIFQFFTSFGMVPIIIVSVYVLIIKLPHSI